MDGGPQQNQFEMREQSFRQTARCIVFLVLFGDTQIQEVYKGFGRVSVLRAAFGVLYGGGVAF